MPTITELPTRNGGLLNAAAECIDAVIVTINREIRPIIDQLECAPSAVCDCDAAGFPASYAEPVASRRPLAEQLDLTPHPEGGWYRQTWRSALSFVPAGYGGPRQAATAIYFALHPGEVSRWHAVRSDELWLWHAGGSLELRLGGDGQAPVPTATMLLGADIAGGQRPQALVPGAFGKAPYRPVGCPH